MVEPSSPTLPDAGRKLVPEPFALVILGASGDLTHRKLIPAVYSLFAEHMLPEPFAVVGFARREKNDESFRAEMLEAARAFARVQPVREEDWAEFAAGVYYHRGDFGDPAAFAALRRRLEDLASKAGAPPNWLFYLATQPDQFPAIVDRLRESGLSRGGAPGRPWSRAIIEKPFGRDLSSARLLNAHVAKAFSESQIFRIDHYLGKETVQNIHVFRFANSMFEPIWNQKYIDHVQITMAETLGVEERGHYYDEAGALRDMIQNHMMQLLCLVAMESPISLDADAVRDEKVKVLKCLRPIPPQSCPTRVVRGQYAAGACAGTPVPGYRQEQGVPADSRTETFVALKAYIDNWRWAGVPFYLRTGKRLAARLTEISVHFKPVPQVLFNADPQNPMRPNVMAVRIQPHEGISLRFEVKVPGMAMSIRPFQMEFDYASAFGMEPPEAYERLILDAALGDSTLFIRSDEVETAWAFVTPIIEGCCGPAGGAPAPYEAGSWGPKEADQLIAADGRAWEVLRGPRRSRRGAKCTEL